MKKLSAVILALLVALMLTGVAYAMQHNGHGDACSKDGCCKADCCKDGACKDCACCKDGKCCGKDGAACAKDGGGCCKKSGNDAGKKCSKECCKK